MKLIPATAKLPADTHTDLTRWVSNYNSVHCTRSDWYKINSSDFIRFAVRYFLDHHTPQKTFFPKR